MRCCEWYRERKRGGSGKESKLLLCILGPALWPRPRSQQMWAVTQTSPAPHLLLASLPYPPEDCPTHRTLRTLLVHPCTPSLYRAGFLFLSRRGRLPPHSPSCPPSAPTLSSLRPIHSCGVGGQPRRGLEQVWGIG